MQVSLEKISNVERKLTITVPTDKIESAYTKQINEFAKSANIKGFRPGKAPLSYIQKRYGSDAQTEAFKEVVSEALVAAVKEHDLKPISQPQIVPKERIAGQPLEFEATFEVLPEIEAINFSLNTIEKLNVDVTPEDVSHVIYQLQKQYATWKKVDRAVQNKDRVVIDYYSIFDGKEDSENTVKAYTLEIGSKTMLPGFEDGLLGAKSGETKTLDLEFPENYGNAEKANKPVTFKITIKEVYEAEVPELNEAFIKRLGIKSTQESELHAEIEKSLSQERDRLVKEKLKEQVFKHMLEHNIIEVPKVLISQEAKSIHDEFYPKDHDHSQHSHDEANAFNEIAKKRVALSLLIGAYAKLNSLSPDAHKVEARIKEIASLYENPQEVMTWLSSADNRKGIESQVLEDQVLDKLLEGVPSTEKAMSYADLKGIQS